MGPVGVGAQHRVPVEFLRMNTLIRDLIDRDFIICAPIGRYLKTNVTRHSFIFWNDTAVGLLGVSEMLEASALRRSSTLGRPRLRGGASLGAAHLGLVKFSPNLCSNKMK